MSVEDWAEIRRLRRAEGLSIKTIARTLGISRNAVRSAPASEGPPEYVRKPMGSAVGAFEDAIRAQLQEVTTMPAAVIAERVGWTRESICRRIRRARRPMTPGISPSASYLFRRSRSRSAAGSGAPRCSFRC